MPDDKKITLQRILILICFIVVMIGLHRTAYGARNYRQDEINTIHAAKLMNPSEITFWMATNIHPPAWRLLADSWIDAFGDAESVVRWSSVLANMLTFAFLFRLGTDLLDWKLGLLAVIILGLYPTAASYMNELRPYPYLILLVTGLHLFFLRWIQSQKFRYMLGYIIFGILALYTHYYAIYIFPAHLIFMLVTVRWNRSFYLRSFSMWVFIGLSFAGWLIPFVHSFTVRQSGGIYYALPNNFDGLLLLYSRLRFKPEELGQILLLLGLSTPLFFAFRQRIRANRRWLNIQPMLYPALLLLTIVLIAWGANFVIKNVTARNMTIIMPTLVILMGLGLRALPKPAHLIFVGILLLGAPQVLPSSESNGPYREIVEAMAADYQADSVLITEFTTAWQWLMPAAYTLMDFAPVNISKEQMLHLIDIDDRAHSHGPPDRLVNVYQSFGTIQLDDFTQNHSQLWVLQEGEGNSHHASLAAWLATNYAQLQQIIWEGNNFPTAYTLSEYARIPNNTNLILTADNTMELYAWEMKDSVDVSACQSITIESWWQTNSVIDTPYTLTIVLADDSGQVAIHEQVPANVFTVEWETERYYRDISQLTIPCDIAQGDYNLLLGIKESISGEALPLAYPEGNSIGTLSYLTTIHTQGVK